MTIAEQLAAEAIALRSDDLPRDVVDQAKRCVLDTIGVGIGGHSGEPSRILRRMIAQSPALPESTVFVSGERTSCLSATLVNGLMVRELDFMDRGCLSPESNMSFGHPSEAIPGLLAVAERQHASGRDLIAAVVLAYEFGNRFSYAMGGNMSIAELGWKHEFRAPYILALAAGRLLGLGARQIAHAMGIAGSLFVPLGILDHGQEQLNMARNLRFPYGAQLGVHAALLAAEGFDGPTRIFEGRHGFAESVARGRIDLAKLTTPLPGWTILNTWIKRYAAEGRIHGPIEAVLRLVTRHDIAPEDVSRVRVRVHPFAYPRTADPATRRHPDTHYTADQSTYYCVAVAILDRVVGPAQFSDERIRDVRVHALADLIAVEPGPELVAFIAPGVVEIATRDGRTYREEVQHPIGHPAHPMSDADVEEKFRELATGPMGRERASQIVDSVDRLESIGDVAALTQLFAAERPRLQPEGGGGR